MRRGISDEGSRDPAAARGRPAPLALFGAALALLYSAALLIAASLPGLGSPRLVAHALSIDLTFFATALYYLLVVRRLRWPLPSVAAVFVLSLLAADALIPAAYGGLLAWLGYLAAPLELFLLGYIARRAYLSVRAFRSSAAMRSSAEGDLLARLRAAARESFSPPLAAELLASELAVFCYAFSRLRPGEPEADSGSFSYHRECSYGSLLAAVLVLLGFELLAGHLLVAALWSPLAAWVLTGLSAYAGLWLLADYKACLQRPIELTGGTLRLRLGLRWTAELPVTQIAAIHDTAPAAECRGALPFHLSGGANLWLVLAQPVVASGPYGITRRADLIAIGADEPARLAEMLRGRLATSSALQV